MSEYIVDYELIPLKWRDGYGLSDIDLTDEIVRCRDCEYYGEKTYCFRLGEYREFYVEQDSFCAWGERRES